MCRCLNYGRSCTGARLKDLQFVVGFFECVGEGGGGKVGGTRGHCIVVPAHPSSLHILYNSSLSCACF